MFISVSNSTRISVVVLLLLTPELTIPSESLLHHQKTCLHIRKHMDYNVYPQNHSVYRSNNYNFNLIMS